MIKRAKLTPLVVAGALLLGTNGAFAVLPVDEPTCDVLVEANDTKEGLNHPLSAAQDLTVALAPIPADLILDPSADGATEFVKVVGCLGQVPVPAPVDDLDFYSLALDQDDVITVDIDYGISGNVSVDLVVVLFGPADAAGLPIQRVEIINEFGEWVEAPSDDGDPSGRDPRIDNFTVPVTGTYLIGVSNLQRPFLESQPGTVVEADGTVQVVPITQGTAYDPRYVEATGELMNGDYTLVVTRAIAGGGAGGGDEPLTKKEAIKEAIKDFKDAVLAAKEAFKLAMEAARNEPTKAERKRLMNLARKDKRAAIRVARNDFKAAMAEIKETYKKEKPDKNRDRHHRHHHGHHHDR